MKAQILNLEGEKTKEIELPKHFEEDIRPDLIKRAALSIQSKNRQPYGADPKAGQKYSSKLSRRRRDYKGSYGRGISRVPRKVMTRRGTQFNFVAATAPGTVGGRRAHPPKSNKNLILKINKKEKKKAIRSAIAATINKELLKEKGFSQLDILPLILENKIEDVSKTKEIKQILEKLNLKKEIERTKAKTLRAGKGRKRGRKYKKKTGPLIVVSKDCKLMKSANNIQGFSISQVKNLNTELLAPGAKPGRMIIWSEGAIEKLRELF